MKRKRLLGFFVTVSALSVFGCSANNGRGPDPDLIIVGAVVRTMAVAENAGQLTAEAVAVTDGMITAIGTREDVVMTASLNVFVKDTGQIVTVLMQIGFWATPVFWDIEIMPENLQFLFRSNPMFYIVQGYRDSFLYSVPFWHHWELTLYFWGVTALVAVTGALVFQRLKPHFADVV